MPCLKPVEGWMKIGGGFTTQPKHATGVSMKVPCGVCVSCRLDKSKEKAIRCIHEAMMHEQNCFLTLTYSNENLPGGGNLRHRDFQKFMKRLRFKTGKKVRFYMCGEYGDGS